MLLQPAAAKSLQSYPTLCDPIDGSPPGSPSLGFSRQEHWSGLPFPSPKGTTERKKVKSLSHVQLFETPWTVAHQAPLSMDSPNRILEWVAISSSRGSSCPRDQTQVSCIAGRLFTI